MADEFRVVDVWVGRFGEPAAADRYFAEAYSDDDDEPISSFAADMGETFYDHDFMEREFLDPPATELAPAIGGHSFSESYCAVVSAAFADNPFVPFDTVLLVWNREIQEPVSVAHDGMLLHYLGRFSCDPDAKPVA